MNRSVRLIAVAGVVAIGTLVGGFAAPATAGSSVTSVVGTGASGNGPHSAQDAAGIVRTSSRSRSRL